MSTRSATNNPRIAAPVVRAITIRTLSNWTSRFFADFVPTCAHHFDGCQFIANTGGYPLKPQAKRQETPDFGQNDGKTGAALHH
ncbi:hypothetical protein [Roseibium sp. RKSG952]|uniref:hypothetical protein n=1 Tax=Roseibium sp. RKSG952 TaxID=2529384 RepID=UPI0018AD2955|nr:hypothetical protein [Roseibium sp. RKSG952]